MILLITGDDGQRDVITNVDRISMRGLQHSSRTVINCVLTCGDSTGEIDLHKARVELLPDDPDAR